MAHLLRALLGTAALAALLAPAASAQTLPDYTAGGSRDVDGRRLEKPMITTETPRPDLAVAGLVG